MARGVNQAAWVVTPFSYRVRRGGLQKIFSGSICQMRVGLHMQAPALNPPRAGGLSQNRRKLGKPCLQSDRHYYVICDKLHMSMISMAYDTALDIMLPIRCIVLRDTCMDAHRDVDCALTHRSSRRTRA